jgi:hypothetical protein
MDLFTSVSGNIVRRCISATVILTVALLHAEMMAMCSALLLAFIICSCLGRCRVLLQRWRRTRLERDLVSAFSLFFLFCLRVPSVCFLVMCRSCADVSRCMDCSFSTPFHDLHRVRVPLSSALAAAATPSPRKESSQCVFSFFYFLGTLFLFLLFCSSLFCRCRVLLQQRPLVLRGIQSVLFLFSLILLREFLLLLSLSFYQYVCCSTSHMCGRFILHAVV